MQLPSFAAPRSPSILRDGPSSVDKEATVVDPLGESQESEEFQVISSPDAGSNLFEEAEEEEAPQRQPRKWYNAVTRKFDIMSDEASKVPYYAPFDPDECFKRNLRGFRVAQALEGFEALRAVSEKARPSEKAAGEVSSSSSSSSEEVRPLHETLLETARPLVTSALQGLSPSQLALAAELYSPGDLGTVQLILREALRRLSNFSLDEIRRLHAACTRCGLDDPYLLRARYRRFPKALRKELRMAAQAE
eukprot:symbB.v1.2.018298.t1/scaffold1381.1/size245675/15